MQCSKCGENNAQGSQYCKKCGNGLSATGIRDILEKSKKICFHCKFPLDGNTQYCPKCGKMIYEFFAQDHHDHYIIAQGKCPWCYKSISQAETYCRSCGYNITAQKIIHYKEKLQSINAIFTVIGLISVFYFLVESNSGLRPLAGFVVAGLAAIGVIVNISIGNYRNISTLRAIVWFGLQILLMLSQIGLLIYLIFK